MSSATPSRCNHWCNGPFGNFDHSSGDGQFGYSDNGAGNVNGDGLADLIVGVPDRGNNGGSYVVYVSQISGSEVLLCDCNQNDVVNFLNIQPFIDILSVTGYRAEADMDQNSVMNFLDIAPFVAALAGN